jgi:hypothetical protein
MPTLQAVLRALCCSSASSQPACSTICSNVAAPKRWRQDSRNDLRGATHHSDELVVPGLQHLDSRERGKS